MTIEEPSTSAAVAEHEAGRLDRAESIYRKRLAANPKDLASLIGLGDVLTDDHRLAEARPVYEQAIALDPENPANAGAYDGLAAVLQDTGDLDGAIIASKKAAVLRGNADDSFGVGNTLEFLGRITDAIEMFRLAATQKDDFADAHAKAAKHLLNMGLAGEAAAHYLAATYASPRVPELHCNLANARQQSGDANGALDSARMAIELKPDLAEAHNIMGVLWKERRRWADSLAAFNRALQLKPDAADVMSNMGVVLEMVGRERDATQFFQRAVSLRPEVQQYHLNLAGNLLLLGDFQRGFVEWEWRRMDPNTSAGRYFQQPMWDGSPLHGKTILIHCEYPQSHTLQFLRYVKLVSDRGGRVLLECQSSIAPLARRMAEVAEVVIAGQPLPAFDVHCPIVSLAKVFGTTIETVPANVPYLSADPEKSAEFLKKLPAKTGLRVGLAWADPAMAPTKPGATRERGLTADKLVPLASIPGIQMFNLQALATPLPAGLNMAELPFVPQDLDDTAALIEHMDVVIGPDVAAAHIAAALGKKTFILLPSTPDWRWLRERQDSPWYPTVKLFRQSTEKSWSAVVEEVKRTLESPTATAPSLEGKS
jgi:tetratricopeptide (TPR) repeat protein